MTRAAALAWLALIAIGAAGCSEARKPALATEARPTPTYTEIAEAWNARAARLSRVWASGVISISYRDEGGDRRYEQGEAHFQLIQPDRLALSAGKLGETLLWVGCDGARYWLLQPKDHRRAFVGRHESATLAKAERVGLPALPSQLPALLGVTPLPAPAPDSRVSWTADGRRLRLEHMIPGTDSRLTYTLDPASRLPRTVVLERVEFPASRVEVSLDDDQPVTIPGEGGFFPLFPSRITIHQPATESTLTLSLERMTAGGKGKLRDQSFDFDALVAALGITEIVDLDAEPAGTTTP